MIKALFLLEWNIAKGYRLQFFFRLLNMVLLFFLFYALSGLVGHHSALKIDYFSYVSVGLIFGEVFRDFCNSAPSKLNQWQQVGVLDSIFTSPQPRWKILLYAGFPGCLLTLIYAVFLMLAARLFFEVSWVQVDFFVLVVTLGLTFVVSQALGVVALASLLLWKRVNLVSVFSSLALALLSGIYFPIRMLPDFFQGFSAIIPFSHAVNLFRWSFVGGGLQF